MEKSEKYWASCGSLRRLSTKHGALLRYARGTCADRGRKIEISDLSDVFRFYNADITEKTRFGFESLLKPDGAGGCPCCFACPRI